MSGGAGSRSRVRPSAGVVLLATGAFFSHAVYPVLVQVLARTRRPAAATSEPPDHAPVGGTDAERFASAVVPAYRERTTIGPLVRTLLESPGSPVAEVVVVADDDAETAAAARAAGAVVVEGPGRAGKSGALGRGIAAARSDVVLLLDANVEVDAASLRRLAEHVRAGRLDLAGGVRAERGHAGESFYWRFENATKAAEQRLGGSLSVVGELMALRRDAFAPVPEWVRCDDLWLALDFTARGLRVGVDTACTTVEPSASRRAQLGRRLRIFEGQIELYLRSPGLFLTPTPSILMLHGHKTWRLAGGPLCQLALLGHAARRSRRSPVAAGWVLLNLGAMADYLGTALLDREQNGRLRSILSQAIGMPPVVAVAAWAGQLRRMARGVEGGAWERVER